MVILAAHIKGGAGKTMLSLNLGAALGAALVDADPQRSLAYTVGLRKTQPQALWTLLTPEDLLRQVPVIARAHRRVVIDAGGRDTASLRQAMLLADLLIAPFRPQALDLWPLEPLAELVAEANRIRQRPLRTAGVLWACQNQRRYESLNTEAEAYAAGLGFPALGRVGDRAAFVTAANAGLSVLEHRPVDALARAEIAALTKAVINLESA